MIANQMQIVCELENRVRNYRRKTQYMWNWSCDVCGDSKAKPHKARFYVNKVESELLCYCHNCGYSGSFTNYTRFKHPDLYTRLSHQKFIDTANVMFDYETIVNRKGMTDEILVKLFYIDKFENTVQWYDFFRRKKINIDNKTMIKLESVRKNYYN